MVIIKAIHQELARAGHSRSSSDLVLFEPERASQRAILGRVIARGLAHELDDRHYLALDALDGRTYHVDIGRGDGVEALPLEAIVRVTGRPVGARAADETVAAVAAANEGRYSVDFHLRYDRAASEAFAQAHVRRLEAMRRARAGPVRDSDGTWQIPRNHLDRAAAFERADVRNRPVEVEILSRVPLVAQRDWNGETWLDRDLIAAAPEVTRDSGFGREVAEARLARRRWLLGQGLGDEVGKAFVGHPGMLAELRGRDLSRAADEIRAEIGLSYRAIGKGEVVAGTYRRPVELAAGRYALIERSRDFTLVPWRPVLERRRGQAVTGKVGADGVSWSIGRERGGPAL